MTLKGLQERLEEMVKQGVDEDLLVRVFADHGQVSMSAGGVGIRYIEDDMYMAESVHPDDVSDTTIKVIEIWG